MAFILANCADADQTQLNAMIRPLRPSDSVRFRLTSGLNRPNALLMYLRISPARSGKHYPT
jgi:hypothetical protein